MAKNKQKNDMISVSKEPVEIELGNKNYKISPPSVGDLVAYEAYIRNRKITEFLKNAKEYNISGKEKTGTLREIMNESEMSEDGLQIQTLEGVMFLLWRCLKKNHKDITLEETGNLISFNDIETLNTIITNLMFGEVDVEEEGKNENPTTKKK